jgi:myo-inositol-1(or 4)-monophosphatase
VKKIAYSAGSIALSCAQSCINHKVSTDTIIEMYVKKELASIYDHAGYYAEESGYSHTYNSDYIWVIDPLDGTTNYKRGIPLYTVSIALMYQKKIILSVIYSPADRKMFSALYKNGSFCNDHKVSVSRVNDISSACIDIGFSSDNARMKKYIGLRKRVQTTRYLGSVSLACAYIAGGLFDGSCFDYVKWWDIIPGMLLVSEASGFVSSVNMDTLYDGSDTVSYIEMTNGLIGSLCIEYT